MKTFPMLRIAATCLAALLLAAPALAANECRVRYAYTPSSGPPKTVTVDLNAGATKTINRSNMLYVENLKNHKVRVYRTGIGSYVDLDQNGRDPMIGNYIGNATLQKIQCLSSGSASSQPVPDVQQLVAAAFQAVSSATVPFLNQVNSWKNSAQQWAGKTASDWGSCPSNGAQSSYNQLKTWQSNVTVSLQQALQIKAQAEDARSTCNSSTGNSPLCNSTYNTLPVHGWISTLNAVNGSLTAAMNTMRNLKCPAGCSQSAQLSVPKPTVQPGGFFDLSNPGLINVEVCTNLNLGSIGFNPNALASGNLAQALQAQPPSCTSTTTIPVCTNWDLRGLLAALQRLNLVPPDVGAIELDFPTRSVSVVTGVETAPCQQALRMCVPSGNVTVSLNESKKLIDGSFTSCGSYLTVACQNPAFGLKPTTQAIEVPDLTKATVRWTGRRPGSIRIDLTRRDLQGLCLGRARTVLRIPRPPVFSMGTTTLQLPFLCTQPNWQNVVANP